MQLVARPEANEGGAVIMITNVSKCKYRGSEPAGDEAPVSQPQPLLHKQVNTSKG
eukprot:m.1813 g.1813  ORF g.1813 m.1813 type:complete len:55 (+) comp1279_c0_seq1:424-588(+)